MEQSELTQDEPLKSQNNSDAFALDAMAGHLIRRLNQTSTSVFTTRMSEAGFDLTPVQFACLQAILGDPGMDQATVAQRIAYDRATIGGVIDRLVRKNWVKRTISEKDRRAKVLVLTPEGVDLLLKSRSTVAAFQRDILPGLTDREYAEFLRLARKVIAETD